MRQITCTIVDDNPATVEYLREYIAQTEQLILVETFTDPNEALKFLRQKHVDFVFLDMEMKPVDGLQFLVQMPPEVQVVICTAHREFAVHGFDYQVCDFLLKGFDYRRFMQAIRCVNARLGISLSDNFRDSEDGYYFFLIGEVKRFKRTMIKFSELICLESQNNLVSLYRVGYDQPVISRTRLMEIKQILPPGKFKTTSKSAILNVDFMETYEKKTIKIRGVNKSLIVGERATYPEFYEWMDKHSFTK